MRLVVIAVLLLSLFAAPASAEPISTAIAALSTWWASASVAIKLVIGLAVNVGVGLLEQYRARKAAANQPRGVTLLVQMGDTLPRSYLIGTRATAGTRKYIGVWGQERKTPNANLVEVRELSCLPSMAGPTGLQQVRIADKYVTVLWDEPHPDGRGYPVEEYRTNGVDYLWIKYLDGTQTTADPYLRAKFGDHEDRPWKSTMIGRGCQAVIMTLRFNDTLFKGLPDALFVPAPIPLYDVRKDSTAGGSGAHRWDNPATWEPSDNLPQMIYAVARGIYYDGRWLHGGRNFATHRLPASSWMAALNEGDRDMGDDRRQFRGGLEVTVDTPGLEIIDKMRLGCAGRLAEVGGSLKLLVGAPAAAVFAITDETIVVTKEQDFEPFPSIRAVSNTIRATYPEPQQGWQPKDAPERSSATLIERDGGQELPIDVDFDPVFDVAQVQCVMATMIEEEQRWRTHQIVLPPSARPLEPNDVLSWSSERNGYSTKKFIVSRIVRLAACLWQVVIKELDPADYDPPSILLPPVIGPTGPVPIPDQVMEGWRAEKASIDDGIGTPRRPAILVGCEAELEDIIGVHVKIRVKETGKVVFDNSGSTPYPAPGTGGIYEWLLSGTWCVPNGTYLVRGRLLAGSRRPTLWSDDIEVTVDNLLLATNDILDEAINELKLADRAVSSLKIQLEAVKAELIENGAIIASKIADAAVTIAKFATGIEPVSIVPGSTVPAVKTTEVIFVDGKLYRWDGTAYKAEIAAADIDGLLTDAQIADIAAAKITGQMVSSQIADAAVTVAKFATGIEPVSIVPGSTVPTVKTTEVIFVDGKLYRWDGTGYNAEIAAADISGQIGAAQIAAIEATKVTGQITESQISDEAISSPKIAAGSVIAGKLAAGAVLAASIAAGAVTTDKLDALAVTADKLAAYSVIAGKVAAGAISATEIAAGAVTASKLFIGNFTNLLPDSEFQDPAAWSLFQGGTLELVAPSAWGDGALGAVWANDVLSDGSTTWYNFARSTIRCPMVAGRPYHYRASMRCYGAGTGAGRLAFYFFDTTGTLLGSSSGSAISTSSTVPVSASGTLTPPAGTASVEIAFQYQRGATTGVIFRSAFVGEMNAGDLIVDGGIVATKLAAGSITTPAIAAGAVTASELAAEAVTAVKLAAGSVTADKLAVNSVTAGKVAAGAISAAEIAAGAITASKFALGNFTNLVPDSEFQEASAWNLFTGGTLYPNASAGWGDGARGALYSNAFTGDGSTTWFNIARSTLRAPVVGGRTYLLRVSMRRVSAGTAMGRLVVYYYDATGASLGSAASPAITTSSATPQSVSGSVTAPAGAVAAEIAFQFRAGETSGVIFRSAFMGEMNAGELIVDGTIFANHLAANSVTTAKIAAGAITAVELGAGAVTAVKIAAGAVTATKINVATLAAISATLGAVNIQDAIVGNLIVGTSNLDFSAVTSWGNGDTGGEQEIARTDAGTWLTLATIVLTNPNPNPVFVSVDYAIRARSASQSEGAHITQMRIVRSGSTVLSRSVSAVSGGGAVENTNSDTVMLIDPDTSWAGGNRTYSIQGFRSNSGVNGQAGVNVKVTLLTWKR